MIVKRENGVFYLEFPKLAGFSGILHGIFTRGNGKSKGPYKSLNVGLGVGDDHRTVLENRKIISRCINAEDLVFLNQVHGRRIVAFTKESQSYQRTDADDDLDIEYSENSDSCKDDFCIDAKPPFKADAMITNIPQKMLVIQTADCQSVLIYDPIQHVAANVHAGWRGTIGDIIGRTVRAMEKEFGCLAQDMIAGIGPSLGPCCAEFVNYKKEIPKVFWKYKHDADHFDFWSISRDQLCDKGVLAENVDVSRICTKCDPERFFSYRGEGATGRFANLIGLK